MNILVTTTSFLDTPGSHQEFLNSQNFKIDKMRGPLPQEKLLPIIANYDAVICGDDEYTEEVLKKGASGKLKYLSKYGVGLDRIDLEAAKQHHIEVRNCPAVNHISVSEHVLALLFTFEKNIHHQYNTVQRGSWERLIGHEIQGKAIGIVGLGAVGKELSKKALALGLEVYAFDIFKDDDFLNLNKHINFVSSIDLIFEKCDIISLHVPHNSQTDKIINRKAIFEKIKKTPIIINTARGKLVDPYAIIEGLEKKVLRAYLTDVLANEPMVENEVLLGVDNVIITPHIGSRTHQSVQRQGIMAVKNLLDLINGKN
jgi:D-3-phosphoglycerate dehydrogenase